MAQIFISLASMGAECANKYARYLKPEATPSIENLHLSFLMSLKPISRRVNV